MHKWTQSLAELFGTRDAPVGLGCYDLTTLRSTQDNQLLVGLPRKGKLADFGVDWIALIVRARSARRCVLGHDAKCAMTSGLLHLFYDFDAQDCAGVACFGHQCDGECWMGCDSRPQSET